MIKLLPFLSASRTVLLPSRLQYREADVPVFDISRTPHENSLGAVQFCPGPHRALPINTVEALQLDTDTDTEAVWREAG